MSAVILGGEEVDDGVGRIMLPVDTDSVSVQLWLADWCDVGGWVVPVEDACICQIALQSTITPELFDKNLRNKL